MTFKIMVLVLVIVNTAYEIILNVVKHHSANNPTPDNLADVYDAETYQKWKQYSAEHCRLSLVKTIVGSTIGFLLLALDAYAAFASLFPAGIFGQLLAVVLLEALIDMVLETVRGYVATMIIEQKYGFNRSTLKTFVTDRIRSIILSFVLALGIAWLMATFHIWMGDALIFLFAGFMFLLSLAVTFLYPVFSRIGNKFVPLEDGELKDRLMALLEKHGYRVKAIEVMDASRRTTKLNAYFTGFGKMKTIVLFDNLLNAMTPDEICAVFAHELGHGLHRDVLKNQMLSLANGLVMGVVVWLCVSEVQLHTAFGFEGLNYGFAYILTGIGLGVVNPLTGIVIHANSRRAEYRADRQAVEEGYGDAMISAFKKLAKDNFAHLAPSPVNVVLEYSHPPLDRRVAEVQKAMQEQK
jgi:STE24 endopeptidase